MDTQTQKVIAIRSGGPCDNDGDDDDGDDDDDDDCDDDFGVYKCAVNLFYRNCRENPTTSNEKGSAAVGGQNVLKGKRQVHLKMLARHGHRTLCLR